MALAGDSFIVAPRARAAGTTITAPDSLKAEVMLP